MQSVRRMKNNTTQNRRKSLRRESVHTKDDLGSCIGPGGWLGARATNKLPPQEKGPEEGSNRKPASERKMTRSFTVKKAPRAPGPHTDLIDKIILRTR